MVTYSAITFAGENTLEEDVTSECTELMERMDNLTNENTRMMKERFDTLMERMDNLTKENTMMKEMINTLESKNTF